ncbi:uncharacterized protein LOC111906876 [Lactuca sativa]|uniref:uncharacterized protein LOC111906876 n=1 Tax=Lactuca sativa TaxID=4236 RepID=UPI000CD97A41|nr:uncharacterized protein LOC111906876 [Lactuca sativa]
MEHITLIKELDSIKDDFTIKVRIKRLWTQKSRFDANETYSIEMVLMDEEGRKIHSSCLKKWFPKFHRYLKEDNIIGHIFEYGCIDTSEQDKSKYKMLLHLQDIEDTKLKVTLWGHNAYYMQDFLANNNNLAPVVFIVRFARVKFINGRPFSSTYFDVSRLFINNDMNEITSYKNKLVSEDGQQLSSSGIKMMESKQVTEHDDFLKNNVFSNIDDLFEPLEKKMPPCKSNKCFNNSLPILAPPHYDPSIFQAAVTATFAAAMTQIKANGTSGAGSGAHNSNHEESLGHPKECS